VKWGIHPEAVEGGDRVGCNDMGFVDVTHTWLGMTALETDQGNTITLRKASPFSTASMASLIRSRG